MTTALSDTFTDATGTNLPSHTMDVGPGWNVRQGTFHIVANACTTITNADGDNAVSDSGQADVVVSVDGTSIYINTGNDSTADLIFRWQDDNNFWLLQNFSPSNSYFLYEKVGGSFNLRTNNTHASSPSGTSHAIKVSAIGTAIEAFFDGTSCLTYTSSSFQIKTNHGIRASIGGSAGGAAIWDNFLVTYTASGVSGTSATTNANDSSSVSGTTTILGSSATTNANDTSSASGTTKILGTSATFNANDTASASGTTKILGSSASTNANDASSAMGSTTVVGSSATNNAPDISVASGTAGAVTGTVAYTNSNDISVASGTVTNAGFSGGYLPYDDRGPRRRKKESAPPEENIPEPIELTLAQHPYKPTTFFSSIADKAIAEVTESARQSAQKEAIDLAANQIRAEEDALMEALRLKKRKQQELILLLLL